MTAAPSPPARTQSRSLRPHQRFAFAAPVEFCHRGYRGSTVTSEIGSDAVVLATDHHPMKEGTSVQLLIDWPAKLDGHYPLRLAVDGKVLACSRDATVVQIAKYEFRLHVVRSKSART